MGGLLCGWVYTGDGGDPQPGAQVPANLSSLQAPESATHTHRVLGRIYPWVPIPAELLTHCGPECTPCPFLGSVSPFVQLIGQTSRHPKFFFLLSSRILEFRAFPPPQSNEFWEVVLEVIWNYCPQIASLPQTSFSAALRAGHER